MSLPKTLFETTLTQVETTDIEGKGIERTDEFGNVYRWIYNASTISSRVGGPACYDVTLYDAVTFLQHVRVDTADEDIDYFAGVFISIIPTLNYGWILTSGKYNTCRVAIASGGAIAIADLMIPSTLVDTTGTAAARPYAFLIGAVAADTAETGVAPSRIYGPGAIAMVAVATGSGIAGTIPQTTPLFIKGLSK
ncbi:MAG: hypothetical protein KAJ19_08805 [Gammaproteobacteria bacterium]|nr:hypothetical protein [Gammaproteobacteria bacterium]